MPKEQGRKLIAQNKKARHDYHLEDTYEAGLVLQGTEVKSLREGRASLVDGFVDIDRGEAWLHQVYIPEYLNGSWTNHAARRKRKLLLHRAEIEKIDRVAVLRQLPAHRFCRAGGKAVFQGMGKHEQDTHDGLRTASPGAVPAWPPPPPAWPSSCAAACCCPDWCLRR